MPDLLNLPTAATAARRRVNPQGALLVSCFGALLAFLDVTIVNVAFPSIQKSFHTASISELSWVLNGYNIVFAALLVAAGRFADLFGRRRMFHLGIVVFTVASGWCAAAGSVEMLIAARAVQAIGAAVLVPASLALVMEAFPPERRTHVVGLWGATAAVASGLGPPLGGALVQADSWRLAFLINVPLGIVAVLASRRVLVESRAPGRRTLPDLRGTALQAAAMALVTLGIVQGHDWGWTSPGVLSAFAAAAVAAALFVQSSRHHAVPVLDPKLLRIPTFGVANIVTAIAGMGFYAYMLNNILWLHYVWGYGLLRAGLAVAPGALVAAVVAAELGKVADARGHRLVAVPGAIVWAGAYVWYAEVVGVHPAFLSQWLPGQVLSGIGVGATLPILASAALSAVPGGRYAGASAIVSSTRQLGAVLGVSVLVAIIGTPTAANAVGLFRDGWHFSALCFGVAAVVALFLRRADRALEAPDEPVGRPLVETNPDRVVAAGAGQGDGSSLIAKLPRPTRQGLLKSAETVDLPAGEVLFDAGDRSDAIYVVRTGRVEIVKAGTLVGELGRDAVIGELGVLTGQPRSATARARRDTRLLRISPAAWNAALDADPAAMRAVTVALANQLQQSKASGADNDSPHRVVSLIGHGDAPELAAIAGELTDALRLHLHVVTPGRVTANGLERAELSGDRVLLTADDDNPAWKAFVLRQSDWTVFVADAATPPPPSPSGRPTYVLLTGDRPTREQLLRWHAAVDPRRVFDLSTDRREAIASLAARIAGKSIGLAISGGGARSLAAIGVLEELVAAGVEVNRVAGCSMGSVVAAMFAQGRDPGAIDAACYDELVRRNPFNDYQLPTVSLARGRKVEAALHRQFGDVHFEELPRDLLVVSTDLLHRKNVVHSRGRVTDAVRASLSLPALYPPARLDGSLHVDGGIMQNLPVTPLLQSGEGPVVAVNIAAGSAPGSRGGSPRMLTLGETLLRSLLMAGTANLDDERRHAAIVVTPDTRGVGLLEFHQIDRIREAGRSAGRAVVEELREAQRRTIRLPEASAPKEPRTRRRSTAAASRATPVR